MRLKTFHADTMNAAMALVREQLGKDAIIVATHEDETGRGVRITAAVEDAEQEVPFEEDHGDWDVVDIVCEALDWHGVPHDISEKLLNAVSQVSSPEPTLALAAAFDAVFKFSPLPTKNADKPFIFFGPPGNGKTVSIAKVAARAYIAGEQPMIVAADNARAGAKAQLDTYAERLNLQVKAAKNPDALGKIVKSKPAGELTLIDTTGVNPYDLEDISAALSLIDVIDAERILVLTAGRDPYDSIELAQAFSALKPDRLLVTGLDLTKRLGGILAFAKASGLPFCDVSLAPSIADGLHPINPVSLARLLLPDSAKQPQQSNQRAQATGAR